MEGFGQNAPDWVTDAIFYQIFPDRFCNGDAANDPSNVSTWGDLPTRENFFGGDLQGIISKLDYL
ncbi:MAG: alpha-amylase family glycosyl hydrolase, partial [Anaerolineaceae bacterium]